MQRVRLYKNIDRDNTLKTIPKDKAAVEPKNDKVIARTDR